MKAWINIIKQFLGGVYGEKLVYEDILREVSECLENTVGENVYFITRFYSFRNGERS